MADHPSSAGGAPFAWAVIGGTAVGLILGETTLGFFAGLAVGVVVALLIWWRSR